jgi:protein SCO1/2
MKKIVLVITLLLLICCSPKKSKLPYLGTPVLSGKDTLYPKIQKFSFTDQDGVEVTNATFKNKIYVADFIFLSCPTICPKMNFELKKVYDVYKNNPSINFLSHTLDPDRDTSTKLKVFKNALGVNNNWYFVTGNKDSIFNIASKSYFTTAYPDSKAPGGLVHSGAFLLIDKNKCIRGVYDGTNTQETNRLIHDIKVLLNE